MKELTQVYQKENWDCSLATVATALDLCYETVYDKAIELFGPNIIGNGINILQEFELYKSLGFVSIQCIGTRPDYTMVWIAGRTYAVTVPSINGNIHITHRILVQVSNESEPILNIFDPMKDLSYKDIDLIKTPVTLTDVWELCYAE